MTGGKMLLALDPARLARAEELLRHPAPGSRTESAARSGVDLTLLMEQLRLTPAERARKAEMACVALDKIRGLAKRR